VAGTGPVREELTSPRDLSARLGEFSLFSDLKPAARSTLAARAQARHVRRGESVFAEGDEGEVVFLILEGKIKITRSASEDRENLLAVLGPGEVFGELSVFDPGPRTASATAVDSCELVWLSHSQLRIWLAESPDVAQLLIQVLARRLRRTNDAMVDLVFADVPGRVAKALLSLAESFGRPDQGGILVEHGLTQEELAQLVGASRETVNKALADFATRGWVKLATRTVLIVDEGRLAQRAR
jgi:CRP/FNR family cyclic AMP-dependent transcriptional regulator